MSNVVAARGRARKTGSVPRGASGRQWGLVSLSAASVVLASCSSPATPADSSVLEPAPAASSPAASVAPTVSPSPSPSAPAEALPSAPIACTLFDARKFGDLTGNTSGPPYRFQPGPTDNGCLWDYPDASIIGGFNSVTIAVLAPSDLFPSGDEGLLWGEIRGAEGYLNFCLSPDLKHAYNGDSTSDWEYSPRSIAGYDCFAEEEHGVRICVRPTGGLVHVETELEDPGLNDALMAYAITTLEEASTPG